MAAKPSDKILEFHPAANRFPMMNGKERQEMFVSIRDHGQQEPCKLLDGKILDGRNRYTICLELGIEPWIVELGEDTDPDAYAFRANVLRRHLTTSQRAQYAAEFMGDGRERSVANLKKGNETAPTVSKDTNGREREIAAETANVSPATMARAAKVQGSGTPELIEAVKDGTIKVADAAAVAGKSPAVQRKAVERVKSGKAKTVREAVKGGGGKQRKSKAELFSPWKETFSKLTKSLDKLNEACPGGKFYKQAEAGFEAAACAIRDWKVATK